MSSHWHDLLDRALEGEPLSEAEARALAAALADPARRQEAAAAVCFEGQLRQRLAGRQADALAHSRERLLAKATLRAKAHAIQRRPARRGRGLRWAAAAAVLLGALYAAHGVWQASRGRAHSLIATGAFRLGDGDTLRTGSAALSRGQRIVAEAGGAELALGGYCRVALDPNAQAVVRGQPRHEAIELQRGRAISRIDPGRGRFTLLTPIGSIEVKGTEFLTSVEYPESQKGERDMGTLKKSAVVTVMVVTGMVACHFGDVAVLGPGMSQVFAGGDAERPTLPPELKGFKGILVGTITSKVTREFLLKIDKVAATWPQSTARHPEQAVGKTIEIVVPENRMLEKHLETLKSLRQGDQIIVEAFDIQGFRLSVMELLRKAETEGGEGERDKPARSEGEGEGEGEGHARIKKVEPVREGEGEGEGHGRVKKVEPVRESEGEGHARVKKVEAESGRLRELEGWVKATPDRDCAGILKVVERKETDEGVREKVTVYRILKEADGAKLVDEANGRRVRLVGEATPGEDGIEPGLVVKRYRVLDAPDQPKRDKRSGEGEGGWREKKVRTEGEGDGGWREKKTAPEGDGERREKKVAPDGEGERREKPVRRDGDDEAFWREKKVARDGERRDEPKPETRTEAAGPATADDVAGFRGMIEGVVVGKGEGVLVLRADKVTRVWQSNTARNPEGLAGKLLTVSVNRDGLPPALAEALGTVRAGDRVAAGIAHQEGKVVRLIEVLRKIQGE